MPTIDPVWRFIIGVVVTTAIAISQGTLVLTNAIPGAWIPLVTAWCAIIAFVGSSITTTISGLGMSMANRDAAASSPTSVVVRTDSPSALVATANAIAAIPAVSKVTAPVAVANATPSDKVVAS
jgi:hypothetical protein